MDMDYIEQLASEFRAALDTVIENNMYGRLLIFQHFPKGCCRYTSDLLAEYIMNNGIPMERIQMVESESDRGRYTHCWLVIDNAIDVDITADQFNRKSYFREYDPISGCYVAPCKVKSLHDCFRNQKTHYVKEVGIDSYHGDVRAKLQDIYDAVIRQIGINS